MLNRIRTVCLIGASLALSACMAEDTGDLAAVEQTISSNNFVSVNVQSLHPYTNNYNDTKKVPMGGVPSCASTARLHFSKLRTEAGYDYVGVEVPGTSTQWFDGSHDDTWSKWFNIPTNRNNVKVRLDTDSSVTKYGFVVDKVEWQGASACPQYKIACDGGIVVREPAPSACACMGAPECLDPTTIEIRHSTVNRFLVNGHALSGTVASTLRTGPADGIEATEIGSVSFEALENLVHLAGERGLLWSPGYDQRDGETDYFSIAIGDDVHVFAAPKAKQSPEVLEVVAAFEALFTCGDQQALTCGAGFACTEGTCEEESSCVCPMNYEPVCGVDNNSYSNGCTAGCADVGVAHDGACGIVGDMCGGKRGLPCDENLKCRYDVSAFEPTHPDQSGACVAGTYCDAVSDCSALAHPMVLGNWACQANACAWISGPQQN
jgi:hypothetical protein